MSKFFDPADTSPGGLPLAVEYKDRVSCPRCHRLGVHQLHGDLTVLSQCASPDCDWYVSLSWARIEQEKKAL